MTKAEREHRAALAKALLRAHSILAVIVNAGLTFDGGVGGKLIGEIRAAEVEARAALCSEADAGTDHG